MKIKMILTNAFDPDPRVYKEAKVLVGKGHEVEILCWDRTSKYKEKNEVIDGIQITRFTIGKGKMYGRGAYQALFYLSFILTLKKYLKGKDYDVIHSHDFEGALAGALLKRKQTRLIWDMHEYFDGFNYNILRRGVINFLATFINVKTDGYILAVSNQYEKYKSKIGKKNNCIIPNTAEYSLLGGLSKSRSNRIRIAFIGSVRDYKNLSILIECSEKFKTEVNFYIHGDGVAYRELNEIANGMVNVFVTGPFNYQELRDLYENADVIYSVYDSSQLNVKRAFPVKVYEAIVCETPVIVSKGTDIGDFVVLNNIGFAIDEKNPQELERVIRTIISDDKVLHEKKMSLRNLSTRYKWETTSQDLLNFYQNL